MPEPTAGATPGAPTTPRPALSGWQKLRNASRPRWKWGVVIVTVLALLLGVGIVAQVRQTNTATLENLTQAELIGILNGLNDSADRLDDEIRALQAERDRLASSGAGSEEAVKAAQDRLDNLGILAGTVQVAGPGIRMTIRHPDAVVTPAVLLDAIQELRDAGAEAIQVGDVRVVASSFVGEADGALTVDGSPVAEPYQILAIGDSQTLASAMAIPGGITETVQQLGAAVTVTPLDNVSIDALHTPVEPRYATPAPTATGQ